MDHVKMNSIGVEIEGLVARLVMHDGKPSVQCSCDTCHGCTTDDWCNICSSPC